MSSSIDGVESARLLRNSSEAFFRKWVELRSCLIEVGLMPAVVDQLDGAFFAFSDHLASRARECELFRAVSDRQLRRLFGPELESPD